MGETVLFDNRSQIVDVAADAQGQYLISADWLELHSAMVWAEHCTECSWPVCYSSCSLYTPRGDLKCRRLRHGIERVEVRVGNQRLRLRTHKLIPESGRVVIQGLRRETNDGSRLFLA